MAKTNKKGWILDEAKWYIKPYIGYLHLALPRPHFSRGLVHWGTLSYSQPPVSFFCQDVKPNIPTPHPLPKGESFSWSHCCCFFFAMQELQVTLQVQLKRAFNVKYCISVIIDSLILLISLFFTSFFFILFSLIVYLLLSLLRFE